MSTSATARLTSGTIDDSGWVIRSMIRDVRRGSARTGRASAATPACAAHTGRAPRERSHRLVASVADDADDLARLFSGDDRYGHALTDRVLARPEPTCHGLVDDDDRWCVARCRAAVNSRPRTTGTRIVSEEVRRHQRVVRERVCRPCRKPGRHAPAAAFHRPSLDPERRLDRGSGHDAPRWCPPTDSTPGIALQSIAHAIEQVRRNRAHLELNETVLAADLTEPLVCRNTGLEPHDAIGIESEVHLLKLPEALDQQSRTHQQHQCERHLCDDERALNAPMPASASDARADALSGVTRLCVETLSIGTSPNRTPVRPDTAIVNARTPASSSMCWTVESHCGAAATIDRTPTQASATPRSAPVSDRIRLSVRNSRTIRAELRAERKPDRHFLLPRSGANEQQACHVGAGDQQHEPDGRPAEHVRTRRRFPNSALSSG